MHSVLMTDNNMLLMGGLQNYVVELDLNTVQETQKVKHVYRAILAKYWIYIRVRYFKTNN